MRELGSVAIVIPSLDSPTKDRGSNWISKQGVVVHAWHPSLWEVEAEDQFKVILGYTARPRLACDTWDSASRRKQSRAGEMAQPSGVHAALAEDQSLVPRHTSGSNYSNEHPPSSGLCGHGACTYCTYTHTHEIKIN